MSYEKKMFIVFLFLNLTSLTSTAQVDINYVASFKQNFSAKLYGAYSFISFVSESQNEPPETYLPNAPSLIGIGASWKGIGDSILIGIDNFNDASQKSKYLDLQYHYYGRRFVIDLFGQSCKGLYNDKDTVRYFYPDMNLLILGGFFNTILIICNFLPSCIWFNTKTSKICRKFFISIFVLLHKSESRQFAYFAQKYYFAGLSAGYAYTWAFNKNYFISGSFSMGFNTCITDSERKIGICPTFFPRISSGYIADKWSLGFSAIYNMIYLSYTDNARFGMSILTAQLTFVRRFNFESKLLDKLTLQRKINKRLLQNI